MPPRPTHARVTRGAPIAANDHTPNAPQLRAPFAAGNSRGVFMRSATGAPLSPAASLADLAMTVCAACLILSLITAAVAFHRAGHGSLADTIASP